MSHFQFSGPIQASKSELNRAWLIKSYFSELSIAGDSNCDDVKHMKSGLLQLAKKGKIQCGDAATVLRFLAIRASRETGVWTLTGSPRLMKRPQKDLGFILQQLGVVTEFVQDNIIIQSVGWEEPLVPIVINRDESSQFASSLLLNLWNLPFAVQFEFRGAGLSEGYWQLSLQMAQNLGMEVQVNRHTYTVPANQKIKKTKISADMDMSSAFAVAAAAALDGSAEIKNFPATSAQPDFKFVEILKQMNVSVERSGTSLVVRKTGHMKALSFNVGGTPDMFPILAVLCAMADGESNLHGAPHLVNKESNRLQKTYELLKSSGSIVKMTSDGLHIKGIPGLSGAQAFDFSSDEDHRMAMAAGLLKLCGVPVNILQPNVVTKSFPEFWTILGLKI